MEWKMQPHHLSITMEINMISFFSGRWLEPSSLPTYPMHKQRYDTEQWYLRESWREKGRARERLSLRNALPFLCLEQSEFKWGEKYCGFFSNQGYEVGLINNLILPFMVTFGGKYITHIHSRYYVVSFLVESTTEMHKTVTLGGSFTLTFPFSRSFYWAPCTVSALPSLLPWGWTIACNLCLGSRLRHGCFTLRELPEEWGLLLPILCWSLVVNDFLHKEG